MARTPSSKHAVDAADPPAVARKPPTRTRKRKRSIRRRRAVLIAVIVLAPVVWSYTTTMLKPSSLQLGVRSVEWIRDHHGNWLVDHIEHLWYSLRAPKKGGPE